MADRMLMETGDQLDARGFAVRDTTLEAGRVIPLHWHDYLEWELVTEGEGEQVYNGERFPVRRGSVYMLSDCDYHSFRAVGRVRLLNVRFHGKLLNGALSHRLLCGPNRLICTADEGEISHLCGVVEALRREETAPGRFSEALAAALLTELTVFPIRRAPSAADAPLPLTIQRATAYINANFREEMSLSALAERLDVSVNYLGTLFKKHTGRTFNDYLNQVRLRYACGLLCHSGQPVCEIAHAAGYASPEYFSCVFRKKMDLTPGEYRDAMGGASAY